MADTEWQNNVTVNYYLYSVLISSVAMMFILTFATLNSLHIFTIYEDKIQVIFFFFTHNENGSRAVVGSSLTSKSD